MDKPELIAALTRSRERLLARTVRLGQTASTIRPADGEWCVLEVVAHLVDTDYFYLGEALAMANTDGHRFRYFDDTAWKLAHPEVRRLRFETVCEAASVSHRAVLQQLDGLTEDRLARPGIHPRGIPYSVADVFYRLASHDENHARQIQEILADVLRPRT